MTDREKSIKAFQEEEKQHKEEIQEKKEALENNYSFDDDILSNLTFSEPKRKTKTKRANKKGAGRPKGSTRIISEKVKKQKLTFTLPKYQKEALIEKAEGSDRSLSDYVRYVIRDIKNRRDCVICEKDDVSIEDLKKVSITISISKEEYERISKFCKVELSRKVADGVRHILKHPKWIKKNILLKER